jgi:hypothetical protein
MGINTICISLLALVLLYTGYSTWSSSSLPITREIPRFLVSIDTGKTHHIQSKTGDASMSTELKRRRAIQSVGRLDKSKIKETRTSTGSTTGALETFFISSICPPLIRCPEYDIIMDAGDETSNNFCVYDGDGDVVYDAGDQNTKVC